MKNLAFLGYENYAVTKDGRVFSFNNNSFKKLKVDRFGYVRVTLSSGSKKKGFMVHRLVALAYLKNPLNKSTVNHIDGDKKNNDLSNLEWATMKENLNHAIDTGLRELQEFRVDRKLSDQTVHNVCRLIEEGFRNIDIARMLGLPRHDIKNIKSGTQYKDIVSQYSFTNIVRTKRKVSTSKIKNICDMINMGLSDDEICAHSKINQEVLESIRLGKFMPTLVGEYLNAK